MKNSCAVEVTVVLTVFALETMTNVLKSVLAQSLLHKVNTTELAEHP